MKSEKGKVKNPMGFKWKVKGEKWRIQLNLREKWKGESEKSDGVALFGNSGGNDVSSGVVSGLTKQIVGGYGVPAVAWAVRQYILIVSFFYTTACSGYGEDAITSYS